MNLNKLSKISDTELILEFKNRQAMAAEIKNLRVELTKANTLIEFVKNASAPASKGTVLEMISRKVQMYLRPNKVTRPERKD